MRGGNVRDRTRYNESLLGSRITLDIYNQAMSPEKRGA
jgi:hypothetical protein